MRIINRGVSTLILMTVSLIVFLSGCSVRSFVQDVTQEREQGYEIIRCLDERDSESLLKLFSNSVKEKYDLDEQIDQLFAAYEGKSVWYDKLFNVGYGDNIDNGVLTKRTASYGVYLNMSVWMDRKYRVVVSSYSVNENEPNKVGVFCIVLENHETGDEFTVGSLDE